MGKLIVIFLILPYFLMGNIKEIDNLSDKDKAVKSKLYISEMEKVLKNGYQLLQKTRKKKDVIQLNCVSNNLQTIKKFLQRSKSDNLELTESISKSDKKKVKHFFTKIYLAHQSVKKTETTMLSCSGIMISSDENKTIDVIVKDNVVKKNYLEESEGDPLSLGETAENEPIQASPYF